jgi:hypothetical protein
MENKDMPAFPDTRRAAAQSFSNQAPEDLPTGLTKREYFAAIAMQGLMAVNQKGQFDTQEGCMAEAAKLSVIAADALFNELSKS